MGKSRRIFLVCYVNGFNRFLRHIVIPYALSKYVGNHSVGTCYSILYLVYFDLNTKYPIETDQKYISKIGIELNHVSEKW